MARLPRLALVVATLAAAAVTPAAHAAPPVRLPAAGTLLVEHVAVRTAPDPAARVVLVLHQLRTDFRRQIVLAIGQRLGVHGGLWYRLSPPMRPNGTAGWVPSTAVSLHPVATRVIIRRGLRRLEVRRDGRLLASGRVAVGAPGMETPLGSFYVTARWTPSDRFYGDFALETSAYSKLSEWPGGGRVGIHGTDRPWLLGQAVSHGCVRVSNELARRLRDLVPLGTPVRILP